MSGTQTWQAALAAFERWQDAPDPAALLAEIEAEDPALAARVRGLIEADRQAEAGNFLAQPVQAEALGQELAGQRLGAWTLQSLLGRGGMGEVWRAQRSDGAHSGEAAIKLLHSPGRGDAAAARFRREGELLARLRHPHIAQLLDIGEAKLGPWSLRYLVIELVDGGERLDAYAAARQLGTAERLALMQQVCSAVAHAHAQLIVHRDLKPGNVLVTPDGQVKLLDFGVAKLLDNTEGSDELTRLAAAGLTPEYAAPEQLRGEPVSVATDVYALGVMLCQLLTGQRQLPGTTSLDADLRALISRATQPRPEDRYASVAALSEDLRRYLGHEPLFARAGPWRYRAGKFLRRHRVAVASSSLVTLSLLAGLAGTWWQWREAAQEASRTRRVQSVMTELLGGFSPEVSGRADVPLSELLRRGWAEAQIRLADEPALRAEVAKPLGLLLNKAGEMKLAAEALALALERNPADDEVRLQLANALRRLGQAAQARAHFAQIAHHKDSPTGLIAAANLGELDLEAGDIASARRRLKDAESRARATLGLKSDAFRRAADGLATIARAEGRWDEAHRWLSALEAAHEGNPLLQAQAAMSRATLDVELGQYAQALPILDSAIQALERTVGAHGTHVIYARLWRANTRFHLGRSAAALAEVAELEALAERNAEPEVMPSVQLVHARLLTHLGQARRALPMADHALSALKVMDPAATERARVVRAEISLRLGNPSEALASLAMADLAQTKLLPPTAPEHGLTRMLLALAHHQQATSAPVRTFGQALAATEASLPPKHPSRASAALLVALYAPPDPDRSQRIRTAEEALQPCLTPRSDAADARQQVAELLRRYAHIPPKDASAGLWLLTL